MARGVQQRRWSGLAVVGCLALVGVVLLVRATGTLQADDHPRARAPRAARGPVEGRGEDGAAARQHRGWSHTTVQTEAERRWRPVGIRVTADDHPRARATLAGLGPVAVVVEALSTAVQGRGWSHTTVQTEAERHLRAAGIRVVVAAESLATPGAPYLYVNVNALSTTTASGRLVGYAAAVRVSLIQDVQLARNPSIRVDAPTWYAGMIVQGPSVDVIRDAVRDLVEKFAQAYVAVNPPEAQSH